MNRRFVLLPLIALLITACAGEDPEEDPDGPAAEKDVFISAPANQAQYVCGDEVTVSIKVNHPDLISDLEFWVDDTLFAGGLELVNQEFTFGTKNGRVGHIPVYLKYKDGEGKDHRDNRTVVVFSDVIPCQMETNVVNTLPHNKQSYTQGLEFYQGRFYEGTGQREQSKLLEVDLKTGTHLRSVDLDASIFGEGITIMNDIVYQISYQAGKCFVYDLNTFEKTNEFSYSGEGWGLCNNGKSIIMSNGSR